MISSISKEIQSKLENVIVSANKLTIVFADGRSKSVPLSFYPRLVHADQDERDKWKIIGQSEGIHWPDLDEDISVEGILAERRSGESQKSFQRWLEAKKAGRGLTLYELMSQTALQEARDRCL